MEVKISPELLARAEVHVRESLITFLKEEGLSKVFSVIAYGHVARVSPAVAKQAIHKSAAWADTSSSDEQLVDAFRERLFEGKKKSGYICYMEMHAGELVIVAEDYKGNKKYGVFVDDESNFYDETGEKLDISNR